MPLVVPLIPVRGQLAVLPSADGKVVSGLMASFSFEITIPDRPGQLAFARIDTGAACSGMSLARAERFGLLRADDVVAEIPVRTAGAVATKARVRLGRMPVRMAALRDEPFEWPIIFHESWPDAHPILLGVAGVVADLVIRFDGTPTDDSTFGTVTLSPRGV